MPQDRLRYFLVAARGTPLPERPPEHYRSSASREFDPEALPAVTLDEAIFDLPPRKADDGRVVDLWPARATRGSARYRRYLAKFGLLSTPRLLINHTVRYHNERDLELYALLQPGEDSVHALERYGRADLMRYRADVFDDKYAKLRGDRPCKTIVAHLAKDGNGYIHPSQVRSISFREAARRPVLPRRLRVLRVAVRSVGPPRKCRAAGHGRGDRPELSCSAREGQMMLTEHTQSGTAAFAPRARLLKLIGAELISDEVVALTELVKNAHDADATCVTLQFSGVTGGHGESLIRDDGHGMDLDTLMSRWMQPAGSAKGREGRRFTTTGRRVLGDKGVGRFAADKLASHLELVSRPTGAATEIRAVFDWDEFEHDDRMLSDVRSRWEVRGRTGSSRTAPCSACRTCARSGMNVCSAGSRRASRD